MDLWIEVDLTTNRVTVHLEGEGMRQRAEGSRATDTADATRTTSRLEDALEDEAALCRRRPGRPRCRMTSPATFA